MKTNLNSDWISAHEAAIALVVLRMSGLRFLGDFPPGLSARLTVLHAQNIPRNVRSQVFAADSAAGGALDEGAVFGRHAAALLPHAGGA